MASFFAQSELHAVPFIGLLAESAIDARLRISCSLPSDWLAANLRADLVDATGLEAPWLTCLEVTTTPFPWAIYALPPARGLTLGALWGTLTLDQQGWLTVTLLKTLLRAWPGSLFPRSGVLCDADGQLWLVPPFRRCVDGASKTWDPWHFEEYAIGGFTPELTHGLAITLARLLLQVPLTELYSLRTSPTPVPSARLAWLAPLDALVAEATDDLVSQRPASPSARPRWAATLAVLEDQCQQASPEGLGALVTRAWAAAPPVHRW